MSDFIEALKKTDPEMFEEKKMINVDEQAPTGITLQDMKDYFEALKQSMTAEMKKEISETLKAQAQQEKDSNTDNGDTNTNNSNKEE